LRELVLRELVLRELVLRELVERLREVLVLRAPVEAFRVEVVRLREVVLRRRPRPEVDWTLETLSPSACDPSVGSTTRISSLSPSSGVMLGDCPSS
jgi:hypothetical protein